MKTGQHRPLPCGWTETEDLGVNLLHYRRCSYEQCRQKGAAYMLLLRVIPAKCECINCCGIRQVRQ